MTCLACSQLIYGTAWTQVQFRLETYNVFFPRKMFYLLQRLNSIGEKRHKNKEKDHRRNPNFDLSVNLNLACFFQVQIFCSDRLDVASNGFALDHFCSES